MKKGVILAAIGMAVGLGILLIPFLTDRRQAYQNAQTISTMTSRYDRYEENRNALEEQLSQAHLYNEWLAGNTEEKAHPYEEQLSFDGNGVMGYLRIPSIDLSVLLYHGTGEDVLAVGAGHLEGTSLPVGGTSSHCVVTAHSGMRNARAFDDIRKLKKGDLFAACIYGRQFVYEVEQMEVVLPDETDSLHIVKGEDRMTLVTCTPYGINDHRLLVHGVRSKKQIPEEIIAENEEGGTGSLPAPSLRADLRSIPPLLAVLIILGIAVFALINLIKKWRRKKSCYMKKS